MQGRTKHTTHAACIAAVDAKRRPDIQRLHDLIRETADAAAKM